MAQIATGIFKQLIAKKQTALNVKATAAAAQLYRRVTSTLDLKKATYTSNEIRPSQMRSDFRHGVRGIAGSINGELSVGTYQSFIESALRALASAPVTTGALITVTSAATVGAAGTFTRSAGSFLTDGFKVGMAIRWVGWTTTGVPNNSHNFLITALTATVMTGVMLDNVAVGAKAAGDSVTATSLGKQIVIPQTGQTRDYWTIEHNFSDIVQSEQFKDCVFNGVNVKLPATGMATVEFPIMGLDLDTSTAAYFTTPNPASSGTVLAAVNGALYVQGLKVGVITSLDFNVDGGFTDPGGVVGANVNPDLFPGVFDISGNVSVLFTDNIMRDYFINETEASIVAAFTTDNTATAGVQTHVFPRVKLGGAQKTDGETGLTMAMPFTAMEKVAGGVGTADFATAYWTQDSAFI